MTPRCSPRQNRRDGQYAVAAFLMILLPANMMAMVMYAFRTERKHITESESRFRNAMEYSAIGMALVGTEGQWLQVNKSLSHFLGYSRDELRTMTFQQLTGRKT